MTRMSAVEHSEPFNMSQHIKGLKKADFKIGYGQDFEDAMKYLKQLGLLSDRKVILRGKEVKPVDLLVDLLGAVSPEPKKLARSWWEKLVQGCGL